MPLPSRRVLRRAIAITSVLAVGGLAAWFGGVASSNSTPPQAPAGLAVTAATTAPQHATLTWAADTTKFPNGQAVAKYEVLRSVKNGAFSLIGTATTTTYTDGSLTVSGSYRYEIDAMDAAGDRSNVSASVGTSFTDTTAPAVPAFASISSGPSQIALSWTAATDDFKTASYQVRSSVTPPTATATLLPVIATVSASKPLQAVLAGLTANTPYFIQITATDASGNVSKPANLTVATPAQGTDPVTTTPPGTGPGSDDCTGSGTCATDPDAGDTSTDSTSTTSLDDSDAGSWGDVGIPYTSTDSALPPYDGTDFGTDGGYVSLPATKAALLASPTKLRLVRSAKGMIVSWHGVRTKGVSYRVFRTGAHHSLKLVGTVKTTKFLDRHAPTKGLTNYRVQTVERRSLSKLSSTAAVFVLR